MNIGFIGLGNMGSPMAQNLLKAGHSLRVFDLSQTAMDHLVQAGAKAIDSPSALAHSDVEVIITMLPAAAHVKEVYQGEEGLLAHVPPSVLLIDCSTIDPLSAREVANAATEHGNPMLDAPVSGGTVGAKGGTLTFMVGGSEKNLERAMPLFSAMGKNTIHCGEPGNGQAAKVSNNMLLGISMIGVAESMALGVALGMDANVLAQVINTSTGRCWSSDTNNPYPGIIENAPSSRDYQGGFGTALMLKDLGLATDAAKQIHQPVVLGSLAEQLYLRFTNEGNGKLDFSAIITTYLSGQCTK